MDAETPNMLPKITDSEEETSGGKNALSRLRDKRRKLGEGRVTELIPVPGYDGELGVKYRWVPYHDTQKIGEGLKDVKKKERELLGAADLLVEACEGIYYVEDGVETNIGSGFGDPTFLRELEIEATDARQSVFATFNNEYAVLATGMILSRWFQDTTKKVDTELLGE